MMGIHTKKYNIVALRELPRGGAYTSQDWDKLIKAFKDDETRLVADVDCTAGGESSVQGARSRHG